MPGLVTVARQKHVSAGATSTGTTATTSSSKCGGSVKPLKWPNDDPRHSPSPPPTGLHADDDTQRKQPTGYERGNREEEQEDHSTLSESVINNIKNGAPEESSESSEIAKMPTLPRKLSEKTIRAQHIAGWERVSPGRRSEEMGGGVFPGPKQSGGNESCRSLPSGVSTAAAARGAWASKKMQAKKNDLMRRASVEASRVGNEAKTFALEHDVNMATRGMEIVEGSEKHVGRGEKTTAEDVGKRRGKGRVKQEDEEQEWDDGDRNGGGDGLIGGLVAGTEHRSEHDESESDHREEPPEVFDWVPEAGLDTSRILSGSRRSSKPKVFTYDQMPRKYVRGSPKPKPARRTRVADDSDDTDDQKLRAVSNRGSARISTGSPRSAAKTKKEKRRKVKNTKAAHEGKAEKTGRTGGERHDSKNANRADTGSYPRWPHFPPAVDAGATPPRGRSREEQGDMNRSTMQAARNLSSSMSALDAPGVHHRTDSSRLFRNDDDADTDITGTATDMDFDATETMSISSTSSKRPPVSTTSSTKASTTARRKAWLKNRGGSTSRGEDRNPVLLTYVTHEHPGAAEDDDNMGIPGGERTGENSASAAFKTAWRRYKRRRPEEPPRGSARAVVWGKPCPACRGESPTSVLKGQDDRLNSSSGSSWPNGGVEAVTALPARPGQYVYLRNAAPEDLRRSLVSEGEFAVPRPDGLFGSSLTGERIRVWRKGGVGGSSEEGRVVAGTFAEADVVQFNLVNGKHRVRFLQDEAVEDVKLMPPDPDQAQAGEVFGGAPSDGSVRWLQRRIRLRNRDTVRRNATGLCEGPSSETGGLVGDEHDLAVQRQENWRWATSRWRWGRGKRDGYARSVDQAERREMAAAADSNAQEDNRNFEEQVGVPAFGDGMFPPIGRILAVERRLVDTGAKIGGQEACQAPESVRQRSELFMKVARLWYPQDTQSGMDPFVHGKAEVFEACRVVEDVAADVTSVGSYTTADDRGRGDKCSCDSTTRCSCRKDPAVKLELNLLPEALAREGAVGARSMGIPCAPSASQRLDAGQPLGRMPRLEPVITWVRACEVRCLASVHPCLDARLNACSGKVVNNPYQPQAEFFLSHSYCLELDAYFPLENVKVPTPAFASQGPDSAFEHPGLSSLRTRSEDIGRVVDSSPRSTKARLLNRSVSDGVCYLPPKWHPLKKRRSFDHSPAGNSTSIRAGSPVSGWEGAVERSGRQDSAASAGSSSSPTTANAVASFATANGTSSFSLPLAATAAAPSCSASDIFLCHRCRHAFHSNSLRRCTGRGCENHFCAPCTSMPRASGSPGDYGPRRVKVRRQGSETKDGANSGEGSWRRPCNGSVGEAWDGRPRPWTGPCCQGRCNCRDCVISADEGILSRWHALNGLAYVCVSGDVSTQQRRQRIQLPGEPRSVSLIPPRHSSEGNVMAIDRWSGWQRPGERKVTKQEETPEELEHIGAARRIDWANKTLERAFLSKLAGPLNASLCEDPIELRRSALDDGAGETGIEWCSSCGGAGPAGSLTRCYYCRGGVHASGCRRFEESLTRRRLVEHGVGITGQLAAAPTAEGAVGHGIAICVGGRWRAGLVLAWSPVSRAHFVRYVDGLLEKGTSVGADCLDSIPWDGEWVSLPASGDCGSVQRTSDANAPAWRRGGQSKQQRARHVGVEASDVRWPLVDVALRLFPPLAEEDSYSVNSGTLRAASAHTPPAPESRQAIKVLKGLMKHTWLASLASMDSSRDRGSSTREGTQKYRPPAVALPARMGVLESTDGGDESGPIEEASTIAKSWVCRSCMEAKLQRFQRRVRSQFQWVENGIEAIGTAAALSTDGRAAAPERTKAAVAHNGASSAVAGLAGMAAATPERPAATEGVAASSTLEGSLNEDASKHRQQVEGERRRLRSDRRLRWLLAGNAGSTRPFAFEAGFVSDLSDVHAHGAPTATGGGVGSSVVRRGKKRPRAPPVARAMAHVLTGLDSQRPLAFALPPDITALDENMATFFSKQERAGKRVDSVIGSEVKDDMAAAATTTTTTSAGLFLADSIRRRSRAVVLVGGTATMTASAARTGEETMATLGVVSGVPGELRLEGEGVLANDVGGMVVQIPAGFTSVKEVNLESSARVRPLDPDKHLILRSSSRGDGRIRSTHRMSSGDAGASTTVGDDASFAVGSTSGDTTTLKDVSKKDRLQRMDQRRMRRQGQELVDAGLLNLDVLQSRRKKLRFGRSLVHAWGVFADEPIAAGDLVIEYRGEIIGNAVADKREKMYEDMQIGSDYMFRVDEDTVVDATFKGSLARFINHSCDPSCTTKIIAVEGSKKIVIYAERDVKMGEELSYDYKFPLEPDEEARVPCRCGSEKCRGFIN